MLYSNNISMIRFRVFIVLHSRKQHLYVLRYNLIKRGKIKVRIFAEIVFPMDKDYKRENDTSILQIAEK